jgi:hypothetical protein
MFGRACSERSRWHDTCRVRHQSHGCHGCRPRTAPCPITCATRAAPRSAADRLAPSRCAASVPRAAAFAPSGSGSSASDRLRRRAAPPEGPRPRAPARRRMMRGAPVRIAHGVARRPLEMRTPAQPAVDARADHGCRRGAMDRVRVPRRVFGSRTPGGALPTARPSVRRDQQPEHHSSANAIIGENAGEVTTTAKNAMVHAVRRRAHRTASAARKCSAGWARSDAAGGGTAGVGVIGRAPLRYWVMRVARAPPAGETPPLPARHALVLLGYARPPPGPGCRRGARWDAGC